MKGWCFDSNPVSVFIFSTVQVCCLEEESRDLVGFRENEIENKGTFSFENHVSPLGLDTN